MIKTNVSKKQPNMFIFSACVCVCQKKLPRFRFLFIVEEWSLPDVDSNPARLRFRAGRICLSPSPLKDVLCEEILVAPERGGRCEGGRVVDLLCGFFTGKK